MFHVSHCSICSIYPIILYVLYIPLLYIARCSICPIVLYNPLFCRFNLPPCYVHLIVIYIYSIFLRMPLIYISHFVPLSIAWKSSRRSTKSVHNYFAVILVRLCPSLHCNQITVYLITTQPGSCTVLRLQDIFHIGHLHLYRSSARTNGTGSSRPRKRSFNSCTRTLPRGALCFVSIPSLPISKIRRLVIQAFVRFLLITSFLL